MMQEAQKASSHRYKDIRPPKGAPNVLVILIDDAGFGSSSAFGGIVQTPNFEKTRVQRIALHSFPHDSLVLSDSRRPTHGTKPSLGWNGRDYRNRNIHTRYDSLRPNTKQPLAET